jgi:hypothetical protein
MSRSLLLAANLISPILPIGSPEICRRKYRFKFGLKRRCRVFINCSDSEGAGDPTGTGTPDLVADIAPLVFLEAGVPR